jgi:hypothetical protein
MGFLDNFLKKLGASMATRYGKVASGEFENCAVVFGNPPKAKMETAYSYSQMVFLKEKEEVARLNLGSDIIDVEYTETIQFPATGMDGYRCKLTFGNGETCEIDLFPSKVRVIYQVLRNIMLEETREFFEKEIAKLPQA